MTLVSQRNGEKKVSAFIQCKSRAKYTVFVEGARRTFNEEVIEKFQPIKIRFLIWYWTEEVVGKFPEENHKPGLVQHTMG